MASPLITITVQRLSGDILSLQVDSSFGIKGVVDALHRYDPTSFPLEDIRVFFLEENSSLVEGAHLGVLVEPPPLTQLLHMEQEMTLIHSKTSAPIPFMYWHFLLEDQTELHVYFQRATTSFTVSREPLFLAPKARIPHLLYATHFVGDLSPRDLFLIQEIVHQSLSDVPLVMNDWIREMTKQIPVYCDCGCIIAPMDQEKHLCSKQHADGCEKGQAFLARAHARLSSLSNVSI